MRQYRDTLIDLVRERLSDGDDLRARVAGGSMRPCLRPGDWIIVEKVRKQALGIGDVVLFSRGDELVVHRYLGSIHCGGRRLILTKGDGSFCFDAPWHASSLAGRVVVVQRGVRSLNMGGRPCRILNSIMGFLSLLEGIVFFAARGPFGKALCDGHAVACDR